MAYTPDDIFYSSMEMDILHEELKRKEKFKKLKKKLLKFFYIFIGFIIGLLPTLLILKN